MATTTEAHHEGAALITNGGNSNVSEIETLVSTLFVREHCSFKISSRATLGELAIS